jgi:DNA-binding response OmpR family regulator
MKRLMMIEDDVSLHKVYKDAFAEIDVEVDLATTGKEGLDKIMKNPPDLILLDIMLPGGMNGFDVGEQLKKNTKTRSIPVLILTNLDSEKASAQAIGAADYLVKANTSLAEVVKKVKTLLGLS